MVRYGQVCDGSVFGRGMGVDNCVRAEGEGWGVQGGGEAVCRAKSCGRGGRIGSRNEWFCELGGVWQRVKGQGRRGRRVRDYLERIFLFSFCGYLSCNFSK